MSNTSLLHLVLPAPRLPHRAAPARASALFAAALHITVAAAIATLAIGSPQRETPRPTTAADPQPMQVPRMIFLQMPGPGGGGGGGGNRTPSPPSRAQAIGTDRLTLPVARPVRAVPNPVESVPTQLVVLPSVTPGVRHRLSNRHAGRASGHTVFCRSRQRRRCGDWFGFGDGIGHGARLRPGFWRRVRRRRLPSGQRRDHADAALTGPADTTRLTRCCGKFRARSCLK